MKAIGSICRAAGFVGFFIGGFYAAVLLFTSSMRDAFWPWGVMALVSLVLIFAGDKFKKKAEVVA